VKKRLLSLKANIEKPLKMRFPAEDPDLRLPCRALKLFKKLERATEGAKAACTR